MARGLRPLAGALLLLEVAAAVSFVHHRYEEMVQALFRVQSECPYVSRVYSIGRSVEGRHLYVLEFSDYPGIHEPREYGGTGRDGTGRDGTGRCRCSPATRRRGDTGGGCPRPTQDSRRCQGALAGSPGARSQRLRARTERAGAAAGPRHVLWTEPWVLNAG